MLVERRSRDAEFPASAAHLHCTERSAVQVSTAFVAKYAPLSAQGGKNTSTERSRHVGFLLELIVNLQ